MPKLLCNENQANCIEVMFAMIMDKNNVCRPDVSQPEPNYVVHVLQAAFPDYSKDEWGELFHDAVKSSKTFDDKKLVKYVAQVQIAFLQNTY